MFIQNMVVNVMFCTTRSYMTTVQANMVQDLWRHIVQCAQTFCHLLVWCTEFAEAKIDQLQMVGRFTLIQEILQLENIFVDLARASVI